MLPKREGAKSEEEGKGEGRDRGVSRLKRRLVRTYITTR
jgi:hypothetical protein